MSYVEALNDANISQNKIEDILEKQKEAYVGVLENIMSNKYSFIQKASPYESKIFSLERIIKINKRAGNTYAVLRDEVLMKSYKLLDAQEKMIKEILSSLDDSDSGTFSKELNRVITKNALLVEELCEVDYRDILSDPTISHPLQQAQENIREFYTLLDVNSDVVNYVYLFEKRMYRLNKYAKYNLIGTVIKINSTDLAAKINPLLEEYGLNVVKMSIILFLFFVIYILRKIFYILIESYLMKAISFRKYCTSVINKIQKPIDVLIIVINMNMIMYVYSDFMTHEDVSKIFNVTYGIFITYIAYKIANVVASIKIEEIASENKKIKNEVINVSIKILNFLILIIGLLILLHFAGVNLTAILSGLGIGGLAVALAAKDSLANFFGTLSILLSDVFSQGDWIVVGNQEGVVVEIGLRVTTIRTFDNALVAIPNAILANQDVKNWTKRMLGRRIKMNIGIKYSAKSQDIKNAVNQIRTMLHAHPGITTQETEYACDIGKGMKLVSMDDLQGVKKDLLVYMDEFTSSNISILVYCFTKSTNWTEWLNVKEDVMHQIMRILEENSLEFALPAMSIYQEDKAKTGATS
ncbi:mechanosensitive ion channel family protein [bacterium]|nr:mechanosensitive ion channel family protein [bacterium]MBU1435023.1 mechanosensitive ion channel family protein [bacterium]MBU1504128.1 mechanosensitive ion channel family protein [bacterium]